MVFLWVFPWFSHGFPIKTSKLPTFFSPSDPCPASRRPERTRTLPASAFPSAFQSPGTEAAKRKRWGSASEIDGDLTGKHGGFSKFSEERWGWWDFCSFFLVQKMEMLPEILPRTMLFQPQKWELGIPKTHELAMDWYHQGIIGKRKASNMTTWTLCATTHDTLPETLVVSQLRRLTPLWNSRGLCSHERWWSSPP